VCEGKLFFFLYVAWSLLFHILFLEKHGLTLGERGRMGDYCRQQSRGMGSKGARKEKRVWCSTITFCSYPPLSSSKNVFPSENVIPARVHLEVFLQTDVWQYSSILYQMLACARFLFYFIGTKSEAQNASLNSQAWCIYMKLWNRWETVPKCTACPADRHYISRYVIK
jgi:hypothetical protein